MQNTPYEDQSDTDEYPDHQLIPQKGGRYTMVFHGPPGTDVGDLHCELAEDDSGNVVNSSGWRPTDDQVEMLVAGAHVRVALWTHPIPPMAISVEPPVCLCHGLPMLFDAPEGAFTCLFAAADDGTTNGRVNLEQAHQDFKPEPVDEDEK